MAGTFLDIEARRQIRAIKAADALRDTGIAALEAAPLTLAFSEGVETDDSIPVTITCTDGDGASVADAELLIELFSETLLPSNGADSAFEVTTGTLLSVDVPSSLTAAWVRADAGEIVIDVTDKTTALAGDLQIKCTPVGRAGPTRLFPITFA